jgi:hypothetical protein
MSPRYSNNVCCHQSLSVSSRRAAAALRLYRLIAQANRRRHDAGDPDLGRTAGACPGYRKDHVVPLACGGPDAVSNMQWQTIVAAKAKDRWEVRACGR